MGLLLISLSGYSEEKAKFDPKIPDKIKAVFDWSIPPEDTATALRFVSNFIKAYDEFNPAGEYQLAIVSHGPEALIFSKKNYEKYKETIDRLRSMTQVYNLKIYVCRNVVRTLGIKEEDLQDFVIVVPAGVLKLAAIQEEGFRLIPTVVHDMKKYKQQ